MESNIVCLEVNFLHRFALIAPDRPFTRLTTLILPARIQQLTVLTDQDVKVLSCQKNRTPWDQKTCSRTWPESPTAVPEFWTCVDLITNSVSTTTLLQNHKRDWKLQLHYSCFLRAVNYERSNVTVHFNTNHSCTYSYIYKSTRLRLYFSMRHAYTRTNNMVLLRSYHT